MASSSSSSSFIPSQGWRYEVFLSFRGEDTRYNFVDHLYAALNQRGLCVFKDDVMLGKGKEISPELLKSIEESMVAIVVFSQKYAESSWCLAELAKIMECHKLMGLKVIPVFYYVDPSDVRGQKNNFAIAFKHHEERFREEIDKVNKWKNALTSAANLSGHHISKTIKEGESTIINSIVQDILGHIRPCDMDNNIIGIEPHLRKLISLLGIDEVTREVRMVGIHGMGGIGKTTIARALFDRIAHNFEGSSFVYDVRENSSTNRSICALQEKVLREVLMIDHNFHIQHPEEGANLIRTRFCHMRVLLVLDDVDSHKQLEFLTRSCLRFGPGSRIMITTRDEQLLSKVSEKYKPDLLEEDQALELFSRHAFEKTTPKKGYEELSSRAIRYAGHLPLAIKVLGSFFNGLDNAGEWESALNRFSKEPNQEIFGILKLSFDRLTESEKKIFLDIACFFKGKHVNHVKTVLDSFDFHPEIGISVLIKKSLVTITSYGVLRMHDLIQEMGWQILRESYPNSRLWQHEEIHNLIKNTKKLDEIEAIVMPDNRFDVDEYEEENVAFSADIFGRMKNLRLLDINGKFTSCEPTFLPSDLRWLRWKRYPFSSLPLADMRKLVGLEVLGGTVAQFWNGHQIMRSLKFMKLEELECLTRFPDVSGAPNIEYLSLDECKNLVDVHESLLSHKRLVKLDMNGCEQLKHLPYMIEMESLKFLSLDNCYSLERLPDILRTPNIETLSLTNCKNLVEVHESLGTHKRIVELFMDGCERLKHLPSRIDMESLKTLSLYKCYTLERFPSVLRAPNIEYLSLIECKNLVEVHESVVSLKRLVDLMMHGCEGIKHLPSKIEMESLKDLSLGECYNLERLPDVSGAPNIKGMDISYCKNLVEVHESVVSHKRIVELRMDGCERLKHLPSKIEMESLEDLSLSQCYSLERLPDVSGAPNIKRMDISYCKNLVEVHESLVSHKRLVTLRMDGCEQLKHLPSTIEMESLVDLSLGECYSLESFPDVSLCMKLSNISLGCGFNTYNFLMHRFRYWELKNIESGLCSYKKLQKLPENLGSMENMKILRLGLEDDFEAFERVLGFKSLHILTNLYSLTKLDLQGRQMEDRDFPKDLHSLSSLENLNLSGNYKLIQLPSSLSHLSNLRCLVVNECHQLRNFHGLPSSLKVLNADDCSSLENIEDASIRCERLFSVSLVNCHKLLEDKENERHLHKIFDSFVKRNAAVVDDVDFHKYLDMRIPGSKIPRRWLKEEEGGGGCRSRVALKQIPQKHISQILGIFICAVFLMSPTQDYTNIYIDWQFEKDEELNGKKEFGCLNASSPSDHNGNFVWIRFEPVSAWRDTRFVAPFIRSTGQKPVRCVARLVYNDDVKSLMPLNVYSRRSNHKRKQQDYQQDHRKLSRLESP